MKVRLIDLRATDTLVGKEAVINRVLTQLSEEGKEVIDVDVIPCVEWLRWVVVKYI
jgi:hypothetical protein